MHTWLQHSGVNRQSITAVVIAGGYHRDNSGGGEALDDPIKKSQ